MCELHNKLEDVYKNYMKIISSITNIFSTNETMQEQMTEGSVSKARGYVNIVFAGWSFVLDDEKSATLKHKCLHNEIKVCENNLNVCTVRSKFW